MVLPRVFGLNIDQKNVGSFKQAGFKQAGFTLLEMLITVFLMFAIGGMGLAVSMDGYRGYEFSNERDSIVNALQKARAQAISNICRGDSCVDGKPHGVRVENGRYVIFQGSAYEERDRFYDEIIAMNYREFQLTATSTVDVVFSQLSGNVSQAIPEIKIAVYDKSGHTSVIKVSTEGRISWD
jgi:Tfp pilus assembly protein FimT